MRIDRFGGLSALALIAACGNDTPRGQLRVLLTDAPLEGVDQVNVELDEVSVHSPETGWQVVTSSVQTFDLLTLRDGVTADLGFTELSTGTYSQIRLHLIRSWIVMGADEIDLRIPSSESSGLKIMHDLEVVEGQETVLTLDFDAAASIRTTGNGEYFMNPVIRVAGVHSTP